uniref:Ig-like domain-containing protein n=1 Tax=Strigops habroptila TaxID=2489341 RepID=A0A672V024_STRHB
QFRLEETGGGLRAPGDSVLLSCRGSGLNFGTYTVRWYRQAPGGTLEWVSFIGTSSIFTDYAAAVKGRATVSRDNSRSEAYLSLRALQPQDSARYFCFRETRRQHQGHPSAGLPTLCCPLPATAGAHEGLTLSVYGLTLY